MKILSLHGWNSKPGGVKPTRHSQHGQEAIAPALPDDLSEAVRVAQGKIDNQKPDAIVGPSRDGAVAMNVRAGSTPLVPRNRADDVIPFADSGEPVRSSGMPASALVEAGTDHRLADPEPLTAMPVACELLTGLRGRMP